MARRGLLSIGALLALALPSVSHAHLPVGTKAPAFATQGAMAGKAFAFNLKSALRKGPVVLYFYPKAFTGGCNVQAQAFAAAYDQFKAANATVIGMSADDVPTLQKFSTEKCSSKFAVGVATPAIIKAYDVEMTADKLPEQYRKMILHGQSDRTSYVIAPSGKITHVYSDLRPNDHVTETLAAVQALKRK